MANNILICIFLSFIKWQFAEHTIILRNKLKLGESGDPHYVLRNEEAP